MVDVEVIPPYISLDDYDGEVKDNNDTQPQVVPPYFVFDDDDNAEGNKNDMHDSISRAHDKLDQFLESYKKGDVSNQEMTAIAEAIDKIMKRNLM